MKASKPATSASAGDLGAQLHVGEDPGGEVVGQTLSGIAVAAERGQHGDAPGPALGGDVTDRDGGVDRCGQELLRDALGLEQPAVGEHPIQPYALVLLQHVHADPQRGQRGEQVRSHEGGQVERDCPGSA